MATSPNWIVVIRAVVELQRRLVEALRSTFPKASDLRFLLDYPKSGEVVTENSKWSFRRHGTGIAFTSPSGIVVDMHRSLEDPEIVDAWRLMQYVETTGMDVTEGLTEAEIEAELQKLQQSGQLVETDVSGRYRLA